MTFTRALRLDSGNTPGLEADKRPPLSVCGEFCRDLPAFEIIMYCRWCFAGGSMHVPALAPAGCAAALDLCPSGS